MAMERKCPTCNQPMKLLTKSQINFGLLIILLFLGIVPGVIYYVWATWNDDWVCVNCTADMVKEALDEKKRRSSGW